ncbi:hypothetical protein [Litorimonas sp. WD9-15]|uniref:hypothetical protein n=1 Tax=Litorimonas sp. WD9-15 TaxID=3418716 RepID=UPI003D03475A
MVPQNSKPSRAATLFRAVPFWLILGILALILAARLFGPESSAGFFLIEGLDRILSTAGNLGLLFIGFYAFITLRLWDRKGLLDVIKQSPLAFAIFVVGISACITAVVLAGVR